MARTLSRNLPTTATSRAALALGCTGALLLMDTKPSCADGGLPSYCDDELLRAEDDSNASFANAYRLRDKQAPDRCEGTYGTLHSEGGKTEIVGLMRGTLRVGEASDHTVGVSWSEGSAGRGRVHVAVQSIPKRTPYRMDTERPASDSSFKWRDGLMRKLRLTVEDLGVLAWDANATDVYLPISWLPTPSGAKPDNAYFARLARNKPSESATITVRTLTDSGGSTVEQVEGDFRGETPNIALDFKHFPHAGTYEVVITLGGNNTPVTFKLRHAEPPTGT